MEIKTVENKMHSYDTQIQTLMDKKRKLEEKQHILIQECDLLESTSIPYFEFKKLAEYFKQRLTITNVYDQYKKCQVEDTCWYSGNVDRLDELELYVINGLQDELGDGGWIICDVCLGNNGLETIIENWEQNKKELKKLNLSVKTKLLEKARSKFKAWEVEYKAREAQQEKERLQREEKEVKENEKRQKVWDALTEEEQIKIMYPSYDD